MLHCFGFKKMKLLNKMHFIYYEIHFIFFFIYVVIILKKYSCIFGNFVRYIL